MVAERDSMEREFQDVLIQKQVIIVIGRELVIKKWEDQFGEEGVCWFIYKFLKQQVIYGIVYKKWKYRGIVEKLGFFNFLFLLIKVFKK